MPEEIKISGLKTSVKEPVENIVSEADAILEEDISVNLPDFSQSTIEAERINDEEKDKEKTESSGSNNNYYRGNTYHSYQYSDPYDVYDYDDPEDFYYDNEDDFDGYEDAEDYWENTRNK